MPSFKEIRDAANRDSGDKVAEYLEYKFEEQSKSQFKQFIITSIIAILTLIVASITLLVTMQ